MSTKVDDLENYFSLEVKVLKACGLSLYGNDSALYKIYSFMLLLTTTYLYVVVAVIDLCSEHNIDNLAAKLVFGGCVGINAVKVTVKLLYRKRVATILDCFHHGYFATNTKRRGKVEEDLKRNCIRLNKMQRTLYYAMPIVGILASVINSVIARMRSSNPNHWELSFGTFRVLNITHSPTFELVMLYQDISISVTAAQFVTIDLLFCNVVSHLCLQFKLLHNSLKRLSDNKFKEKLKLSGSFETSPHVFQHYLQRRLRDSILHHVEIIKITAEIENVYSKMLLVIYLANMVIFCFGLYYCSTVSLLDPKVRAVVVGTMGAWFQSLVVCFWCNDLTYNSELVSFAAYQADFICANLSIQKDLAFIMRRSLTPTVITAGKFFSITLTTFVKAQQLAYSAFMVLKKMSSLDVNP